MRDSEPASPETEPRRKRELKGHVEGSHSPFGTIWQVATATGWSRHHIMWKINYQTLIMMTSDAIRYVTGKEKEKKNKGGALGYFQSRLKE